LPQTWILTPTLLSAVGVLQHRRLFFRDVRNGTVSGRRGGTLEFGKEAADSAPSSPATPYVATAIRTKRAKGFSPSSNTSSAAGGRKRTSTINADYAAVRQIAEDGNAHFYFGQPITLMGERIEVSFFGVAAK
jgi:hypothetical protein